MCHSVGVLTLLIISTSTLTSATLSVISEKTNETVFSTEEAGIDSASAYKLSGRLVLAVPLDACHTVDAPPPIDPSSSAPHSYILLATVGPVPGYEQGSDCSLARKAKIAQAAGYAGIVLRRTGSNDSGGVIPQFIGLDWLGVRIYACVVGDAVGAFLMQNYAYPSRFYARFENEPYYPIGLLTNFVVIGILAILTVLLLLKLFHYLYFSVTTRVVERRRIRKTLLSAAQLGKLPVLRWSPTIPQDTCSICIELFEAEDEIRVLPCSHVFHKVCIDPWLLKESRKCPNCKGRVLFPNERSYTYSSDSEDVDESEGDERTPLLRPRENYRFIETLTESHNSRTLASQQDSYHAYLQEDDPLEEEDNHPPPAPPPRRKSTTKVSFAPAVSVLSSTMSDSSNSSFGSNSGNHHPARKPSTTADAIKRAFVLPMMGPRANPSPKKSMLKSPLRGLVINQNEPGSSSSPSGSNIRPQNELVLQIQPPPIITTTTQQHHLADNLSPCSSTSSDQTLIDFYDPEQEESRPLAAAAAASTSSLSASCASFHSCEGFESEYPSFDGTTESGSSKGCVNYGSFQSSTSSSSGSYHA